MKQMFRMLVLVLVVVALVVGGAWVLKKRKAMQASAPKPAPVPVVVDTIRIERKPVRLTLPAMAEVVSDTSVQLSAKFPARISAIFKPEGSTVRAGETVGLLDDADLRAKAAAIRTQQASIDLDLLSKQQAMDAARIALEHAERSHERTRALFQVKGASIEQMQDEETRIASLKAQLEASKNAVGILRNTRIVLDENLKEIADALSYTRLVSPIDGVVAAWYAHPGDMAVSGKPIVRIVGSAGMVLAVRLPEHMPAEAVLFHGKKLSLISRKIAGPTGLWEYRAALPPDAGVIEGDMPAIDVVVYEGDGPLIPVEALLRIGDRDSVLIYRDGKAVQQPIRILARGVEGVVTDTDVNGSTLVAAPPDLLLRILAGVPVKVRAG